MYVCVCVCVRARDCISVVPMAEHTYGGRACISAPILVYVCVPTGARVRRVVPSLLTDPASLITRGCSSGRVPSKLRTGHTTLPLHRLSQPQQGDTTVGRLCEEPTVAWTGGQQGVKAVISAV